MKALLKNTGLLFVIILYATSCSKQNFLDAKPNSSIVVPNALSDLRGMLDYTMVFTNSPGLGEVATDNYYLQFPDWQALSFIERSSHTWETDLYGNQRQVNDWNIPWQQIFYCNIVLEQLDKSPPRTTDLAEWKDIRGTALFSRAWAYAALLQHFAPAFDSSSMGTDLGVPIRTGTNVHQYEQRASLQIGYDQVFHDLTDALSLLGNAVPVIAKNRPSRPAVYALLARACLFTRQFQQAACYADSCLSLYNKLIDYNTISTISITPFDRSNAESIYFCQAISDYSILFTSSATVLADSVLYRSYAANDLRKSILFRTISGNNIGYKRGYGGTILAFTGLATDEVLLIRAEALARLGNTSDALNDLNTLLVKRWKTGSYIPLTANTAADALTKILAERRKELPWRGLRWPDLKRLNKEGYNITLTRNLNGQSYSLPPNSPRYVFAIPADEIALSGIAQNPR